MSTVGIRPKLVIDI